MLSRHKFLGKSLQLHITELSSIKLCVGDLMVIPFKLGGYNNTEILDFLEPQNWVRINIIIKTNRGTLITDVKSLTLVRV